MPFMEKIELLKEKKRHRIIQLLPIDIASEAISEMDPESHPEKLLESLNSDLVTNIVEELSYDDATDIVSQLSESKRDEILDRIDVEDAAEIRKLLVYPEDTAGGLMTTEIVKIHCSLTKKEALEEVALQSEEIEAFYAIYVVDDADRLVGTVSLKNLITDSILLLDNSTLYAFVAGAEQLESITIVILPVGY